MCRVLTSSRGMAGCRPLSLDTETSGWSSTQPTRERVETVPLHELNIADEMMPASRISHSVGVNPGRRWTAEQFAGNKRRSSVNSVYNLAWKASLRCHESRHWIFWFFFCVVARGTRFLWNTFWHISTLLVVCFCCCLFVVVVVVVQYLVSFNEAIPDLSCSCLVFFFSRTYHYFYFFWKY